MVTHYIILGMIFAILTYLKTLISANIIMFALNMSGSAKFHNDGDAFIHPFILGHAYI